MLQRKVSGIILHKLILITYLQTFNTSYFILDRCEGTSTSLLHKSKCLAYQTGQGCPWFGAVAMFFAPQKTCR